jgi:tyrosyl-tRNA synthetase
VQEGSLQINKEKITNAEQLLQKEHLLKGKFLMIKRGKKDFLVIAEK